MQSSLTPKTALLSAAYVVVLVLFLYFLNLGLLWVFNRVIFDMLDWFNQLKIFWKILLLIFGGLTLFGLALGVISAIPNLVGNLLGRVFPANMFTTIAMTVIALANTAWSVTVLWKAAPPYDFWVVMELIILSVFIWTLNWSFVPGRSKSD